MNKIVAANADQKRYILNTQRARVLVVDDEPMLRQYLRTLLSEIGCDVVEASNGAEAIRGSRGLRIDLLITDLVMPDKEGIELIRHFRKSLNHVKVIAISGAGFDHCLKAARMLGADAVFPKPFHTKELLAAVRGLLNIEQNC